MANAVEVVPVGVVATASFTPTAEAYDAGDIIRVATEFKFYRAVGTLPAGAPQTLVPPGSIVRIITSRLSIGVTSVPSGQTSYSLPLYNRNVTTQGNNDAWAIQAAELDYYRGTLQLGTPVDIGGALFVRTEYVDFTAQLNAQSSLWGQLVTAGGFTATAVARTVELIGILI